MLRELLVLRKTQNLKQAIDAFDPPYTAALRCRSSFLKTVGYYSHIILLDDARVFTRSPIYEGCARAERGSAIVKYIGIAYV